MSRQTEPSPKLYRTMQPTRNSALVTKAMYSYIITSILAMVAQQINTIVDGIIVGQIVSPDALSAITVFLPVGMLMTALTTFVVSGAVVLLAGYIGDCDQNKIDRTLAAIIVCVCVLAVMYAVLAVFAPDIANMLCEDATIRPFLTDYLKIYLTGGGVFMVNILMAELVGTNGHTSFLAQVTAVVTLINIILDYTFMAWLDMGISGSATATVLAMITGSVIFLSKLYKGYRHVFLRPFKLLSLSFLKANLKEGLPLVIGNLMFAATFLAVNTIVMDSQGADGMFALSVSNQALFIGMTLASGIGYSVMTIGAFLLGQKDEQGFSFLVKKCLVLVVSVSLLLLLVIHLWPSGLTNLFGADTQELANYTNQVICVTSWVIPPFLLLLFHANQYVTQGYLGMSVATTMLFPICLIPSLLWMSKGGNIWLAYPVTGVAMLVLLFAITEVYRHKKKGLAMLTLLHKEKTKQTYDYSVKNDDGDSIRLALESLVEWMQNQSVSHQLRNDIVLCIKELLMNIVNHTDDNKVSSYIDIHISIHDDHILTSVKDAGKPFDPTACLEKKHGGEQTIDKTLCPQCEYKYMFGQNVTFLKWKLK